MENKRSLSHVSLVDELYVPVSSCSPGKVLPNVFWLVARILKSLPYVRPNSDKSEATIPILDLSKTNCKT